MKIGRTGTGRILTACLFAAAVSTSVLLCCCNGGNTEKGGNVNKTLNKPGSLALPEYRQVSAESEKYRIHDDGGLIYNALSKEAGDLTGKYDGAKKRIAKLITDGMEIELKLPTELTAYDMIPIDYRITSEKGTRAPLTVEAVAYEEAGRYDGNCFDLTSPGSPDISYEYLGYVTGTVLEGVRNNMQRKNNDTPAAFYPDFTVSDLNPSGTVMSADLVWLKFRYTNTGNTVLDCEGQGNFNIFPRLFKKSTDGSWTDVGGTFNQYIRELTYVYPGESREFYVNFLVGFGAEDYGKTAMNLGLLPGEYKVVLTALYRTELDYNAEVNLYHGRTMNVAEYLFSVSDTAKDTKAGEVRTLSRDAATDSAKRSWLHYFEEFMTTFEQHRNGVSAGVTEGRIYLQCAPWTDQIVIKVIHSDPQKMISVKVPVRVSTDGTEIVYDPDNINVIVNSEGYEEPVICIQSMPDLRANVQISPYPQETIIRDLLTMKECGANVTSWQGFTWLFDSVADQVASTSQGTLGKKVNLPGDSLKYALDVCRGLGLKSLGLASYPYGRNAVASAASWLSKKNYSFMPGSSYAEADYSDPKVAEANAIVSLYERSRWGDLYWSDATGRNVYTIEDTRGLMRYEHQCRYGIGEGSKKAFREWLREKYGTVEALNKAWGSDYSVFLEIDPERDQPYDDTAFGKWVYYTNRNTPFYEWSPAIIDLDIFRTQLRVDSYESFTADMRKQDDGASVQMRTEGSQFIVPGLDPDTTNPHYRQIIYSQLKGAAVAELIAPSDAVSAHCDYTRLAMTPSEVRYLTRKSTDNGIISMLLPQFHDMRDIALNDVYGEDYRGYYNLSDPVAKGAYVHQLTAVFPWWKATYEEGGVPGILWQDFECNGFVTETQIKEMKFFREKLLETLSDPKVAAMRKTDRENFSENVTGKNTYDPEFIRRAVENILNSK